MASDALFSKKNRRVQRRYTVVHSMTRITSDSFCISLLMRCMTQSSWRILIFMSTSFSMYRKKLSKTKLMDKHKTNKKVGV